MILTNRLSSTQVSLLTPSHSSHPADRAHNAQETTSPAPGGTTAQSSGIAKAATYAAVGELGGRAAGANAEGGAEARAAKAGDEEEAGKKVTMGEEGKRAHVGVGKDQSGVVGGGGGQK